jgi:hypothetical protein
MIEGNWYQNSLVYPYDSPEDICPTYDDLYERPLPELIESLALVAESLLGSKSFPAPLDENYVRAALRIAKGETLPSDFHPYLSSCIQARPVPTSTVIRPGSPQSMADMLAATPDLRSYEQVIMVNHLPPNNWVIFFVHLPTPSSRSKKCSIDIYVIGQIDPKELETLAQTHSKCLKKVYPGLKFSFQHRLHVPLEYDEDPVFLAYVLSINLHLHGTYLTLDSTEILRYKINAILLLKDRHDFLLGQWKLQPLGQNYPFLGIEQPKHVDNEEKQKDDNYNDTDFPELVALGWYVVDVLGDGNCGYYALLVGLVNIGIMTIITNDSNRGKSARTSRNSIQDW